MGFSNGDRVRIRAPRSEYTGCRGTIADPPGTQAQGELPLGHMVAVDGENGVTRPFLVQHLERLAPARVRRDEADAERPAAREGGGR